MPLLASDNETGNNSSLVNCSAVPSDFLLANTNAVFPVNGAENSALLIDSLVAATMNHLTHI